MGRNAVNKRQNRGSGRQRLTVSSLDNLYARLGLLSEDVGAVFDPVEEPAPAPTPDQSEADSILEIVMAGALMLATGLLQIHY